MPCTWKSVSIVRAKSLRTSESCCFARARCSPISVGGVGVLAPDFTVGGEIDAVHGSLGPRCVVRIDWCSFDLTSRQAGRRAILILTHSEQNRVVEAIVAGASGYIVKTATPAAIVAAVEATAAGGAVISSQIAGRLMDHIRQREIPVTAASLDAAGATVRCSPRANSRCSNAWQAGAATIRSPPSCH